LHDGFGIARLARAAPVGDRVLEVALIVLRPAEREPNLR
jgi:hypothetical protein